MKQPLFPSTMGTQSRFAYFLTAKAVVRKFGKSDGQTGSRCLDKAVLAQGGGGGGKRPQDGLPPGFLLSTTFYNSHTPPAPKQNTERTLTFRSMTFHSLYYLHAGNLPEWISHMHYKQG